MRLGQYKLVPGESRREESETTDLSDQRGFWKPLLARGMLEPCAVKVARTVLRGAGGRKATCLPGGGTGPIVLTHDPSYAVVPRK
jgi:hypothetical protein